MRLVPGSLTLAGLQAFAGSGATLTLDAASRKRLDAGAESVRRIVAKGSPVYGINTGFGKLAQSHIAEAELELRQRNLVLAHSAGVGPLLGEDVVSLTMLPKRLRLARGCSAARSDG